MLFKYSPLALLGLTALSSAAPLGGLEATRDAVEAGSFSPGTPCWKTGTCKRDDIVADIVVPGLPCWKVGTCKRGMPLESPDLTISTATSVELVKSGTPMPCWKLGTCKRQDLIDLSPSVTGSPPSDNPVPCSKAGTCKREQPIESSLTVELPIIATTAESTEVSIRPCWKSGTCKRGEPIESDGPVIAALPSRAATIHRPCWLSRACKRDVANNLDDTTVWARDSTDSAPNNGKALSPALTNFWPRDTTTSAPLGEQSCTAEQQEGSSLKYHVHLGMGWNAFSVLAGDLEIALESALGIEWGGSWKSQSDENGMSQFSWYVQDHGLGATVNTALGNFFGTQINGFNCPSH